jgi:hypothetical protein
MTHRWLQLGSIVALAVSMVAGSASAAEIFKWIDDQGTVHYSDTKPNDNETLETLRLADRNAADYNPATDPYSIMKQAERIGDAWTETRLESRAQSRAEPSHTFNDGYDEYADRGYTSYVEPAYSAYAPPIYLPTRPLLRPTMHAPNAARRQADALHTLDVAGQRPHSINSGAHRSRVLQSRNLPLTPPR